jgi:hypothetical protein
MVLEATAPARLFAETRVVVKLDRRLMRWLSQVAAFILLACGLLLAASVPSSNPADQGDSAATIKTTTRIVLLDVLVTNKAGRPVHGLKASDFTVLEDGKPQQVRGFEERGPALNVSSAPYRRGAYLPTRTPTTWRLGSPGR